VEAEFCISSQVMPILNSLLVDVDAEVRRAAALAITKHNASAGPSR
jgi:vesicle coat complex subunit